jgi:hypothetical protein
MKHPSVLRNHLLPNPVTPVARSLTVVAAVGLLLAQACLAQAAPRTLARDVLRDKIRGAWAGQMIGVVYGAPTEFRSLGKINEGAIKAFPLTNAIVQDDLYVEMTFARVMDTVGLDATTADYGEAFKVSQYHLWHANACARRNLNRGIPAPMSGHPRYNQHADDIDFQIEADFIGIMCPGLPRLSNQYCERVGRVMNYGDGLYGGMFVCGMYTAAYFETNPRKVVAAGLGSIPVKSPYAQLIRDLLDWSAQEPKDWRKVWQQVEAKWDRDDPCPDGAFRPFNIDAKLNGAYIAFGLLYGQGDWQKTMEIATRCGQDSDCNPSSAMGVLGAMIGYAQIPADYKPELDSLADTKFDFTEYSFNEIVKSTETRALKVIQQAGGKVSETEVVIPQQSPKAPKLALSNFGVPTKVLWVGDAAWNWQGNWVEKSGNLWGDQIRILEAEGTGSEATLKFNGTGVALVGDLSQAGGRADVYVDGRRSDLLADAYIVPKTYDNDLWRIHGLKPGEHTLRLVTTYQADPRSQGRRLTIQSAVTYR